MWRRRGPAAGDRLPQALQRPAAAASGVPAGAAPPAQAAWRSCWRQAPLRQARLPPVRRPRCAARRQWRLWRRQPESAGSQGCHRRNHTCRRVQWHRSLHRGGHRQQSVPVGHGGAGEHHSRCSAAPQDIRADSARPTRGGAGAPRCSRIACSGSQQRARGKLPRAPQPPRCRCQHHRHMLKISFHTPCMPFPLPLSPPVPPTHPPHRALML